MTPQNRVRWAIAVVEGVVILVFCLGHILLSDDDAPVIAIVVGGFVLGWGIYDYRRHRREL